MEITVDGILENESGQCARRHRGGSMWKLLVLTAVVGLIVSEVAAMLTLGGMLGLGWTLIWIAGSAMLGIALARQYGLATLIKIHQKLRVGVLPTTELLDMGMILVGAVGLMLPGFVTDSVGLLLVLPPSRWVFRIVLASLIGTFLPSPYPFQGPVMPSEDIIEIQPDD